MDWTAVTDRVLIATVVGLCLYDVAARVFGGNEATISARLQLHGHRWPIIVGAIGLIIGHIFWPVWSSGPR